MPAVSRVFLFRFLAAAGIAAAVVVPRAMAPATALTIDESLWIDRSDRFVTAVFDGRFGDAIETGHPGVPTMWIGGLAQRTLGDDATLKDRYGRARIAMSIAAALLLLVVWRLLSRLAGEGAGAAGAFLVALDPFVGEHLTVLHLDGLMTLAALAAFLALLLALRNPARRGYLIASGAFAGLALVTKQPALFLVFATLVALWRDGGGIVRRFVIWAGSAAAVYVLIWPGVWARPLHVAGLLLSSAGRGATDDSTGFFLGRHVGDPGPLFYPIAFLWRSSILMVPATIATAVWAARKRRVNADARLAAALLLFALAFMAFMSVGMKKGDRYVLPSFAAAGLAVGVASVPALRWIRNRAPVAATAAGAAAAAGVAAAALAVHAVPGLALHPYRFAHFNWLAGGPKTAQHVLVVGWGEGLDEAATALSGRPGATTTTIAASRVTQFEEFYAGTTVRLQDDAASQADLVLFYISSVQTGRFNYLYRKYESTNPLYTLEINGLPYVRVWRAQP